MIHGIDVSAYQPKPRWREVRDAGADFAIVKITDGNTYVNPHAAAQVAGALDVGLIVMLYHYAKPNGPEWRADAVDESMRLDGYADRFESKLNAPLFCFLDVERNTALTSAEIPLWRGWVDDFRHTCVLGERAVGWYSYSPFTAAMALDRSWENTLLWGAGYPKPFRRDCSYAKWPDAPLPWARVDLWQHGGDSNGATWPGIDGACDVNSFAGSREELVELVGAAR